MAKATIDELLEKFASDKSEVEINEENLDNNIVEDNEVNTENTENIEDVEENSEDNLDKTAEEQFDELYTMGQIIGLGMQDSLQKEAMSGAAASKEEVINMHGKQSGNQTRSAITSAMAARIKALCAKQVEEK